MNKKSKRPPQKLKEVDRMFARLSSHTQRFVKIPMPPEREEARRWHIQDK